MKQNLQVLFIFILTFISLENVVECNNCPVQKSIFNFQSFQTFNMANSYQAGDSQSFSQNMWVISQLVNTKVGLIQRGIKTITCDQGQKMYYLLKDDSNKDNVVYQIPFKAPKNTKQLFIRGQVVKIKDLNELDKIYIDVYEGDISSPKTVQSYSINTVQQSGVSFSCQSIGYYPQNIEIYAPAYEGNFFIRVRLERDPNAIIKPGENIIFGISSFSVDALFVYDEKFGECQDNVITECASSSAKMKLNDDLKQCVLITPCKNNQYYSFGNSNCKNQKCSSQEYTVKIEDQQYCLINSNPCDENKFGFCSTCDQKQLYCSKCFSGYGLTDGVCDKNNKGCSKSQFYDQKTNKCIDCSNTLQNCASCGNESSCTFCNPGYYLTQKTENGREFSCQPCPNGCQKCQFTNSCEKCNPPYEFLNGQCTLKCASNQVIQNGICEDCSTNCMTCTSSTVCTKCQPRYLLKESQCVADCGDGYFQNGLDCKKCSDGCLQCTNESICGQCKPGFDLINNQCQIKCSSGFYRDSSTQICLQCSSNCLQCSGIDNCQLCSSNYLLQANVKCVQTCEVGYFQVMEQCNICIANCDSCNDQNSCKQCKVGYEYIQSKKQCLLSCKINTEYRNETTFNCENCSVAISDCLTCENKTKCTSCSNSNVIQEGFCVNQCTDGYYLGNDNICHKCLNNCLRCDNVNTCLTCKRSYVLNSSKTCDPMCQQNQFLNNINVCQDCMDKCFKCTNLSTCLECENGYQVNNNKCQLKCQQGQYLNNNVCEQCMAGCTDCKTKETCNLCEQNFDSISSKCYSKCNSNQFRDPQSQLCTDCILNCEKCQNLNQCDLCSNNFGYYKNINKCVINCPKGQFSSNDYQSCLNCPSQCSECQSSQICSDCKPGFVLEGNECNIQCKSSQYKINNSTCKDCPKNCSSCQNLNGQQIIDDSLYQQIPSKQNMCLKQCKIGEYENNGQCLICISNCQNCIDGNTCYKCYDNYQYINGKCEQKCTSIQFFNNSLSKCEDCSQNCLICNNINDCQKCENNFDLFQNKICLQKCQTNQYRKDQNCIQCPQGCTSCSFDINCLSCDNNYQLDKSSSLCQKICEQGEYLDNNNNSCIKKSYNKFQIKPTSPLEGDKMPIVTIYFTKQINQNDLNSQQILKSLKIDIQDYQLNQDYEVNCIIKSNTQIELHFQMKRSIKNKDIKISIIDDDFKTRNDFIEKGDKQQIDQIGVFPNYIQIDETTKEQTQSIKNIGNAVSTSIVSSVIPIILFSNFSLLFNALDLFQMIFYLRYVNIRHPYNIIAFLDIFQQFQFPYFPNINDPISDNQNNKDINGQSLHLNGPYKFIQSDFDCLFLNNAGQDVTQYLILLGMHISLRILSIAKLNPFKWLREFIQQKVKVGWEWGWHLDCLWEMYLCLIVSSFVSFYEIFNNPQNNPLSIINYMLSIAFFFIVFAIPISFTYIVYKNQNNLHQEQFKEKWGMLIEGIQISNQYNNIDNKTNQKIIKDTNYLKIIPLQSKVQKSDNNIELLKDQCFVLEEDSSPSQGLADKQIQKQNKLNEIIMNEKDSISIPIATLLQKSYTQTSSPMKRTQITQIEDMNTQQQNQNLSKLNKNYFQINKSQSKISQYAKFYYCLLYFRKLFFSIMIVFLHNQPLIQLLFLDFLNIAIFLFIVNTKPYIHNLENIKSAICELLIIIAQICLKILIKDGDNQIENDRLKIGWVFISACIFILIIQFFYLLYSFLAPLYPKIKARCLKKKQNKIHPDRENVEQTKNLPEIQEISFNKLNITQKQTMIKQDSIQNQTMVQSNTYRQQMNVSSLNQSQNTTNFCIQDNQQKNNNHLQQLKQQSTINLIVDINVTYDNIQIQQDLGESKNATFRQSQHTSQLLQ